MNKVLLQKVKTLCKDTGLSEKYLTAITEKLSGSLEDDSADETALEAVANQIAEIAFETQAEATRWASKKNHRREKEKETTKKVEEPEEDPFISHLNTLIMHLDKLKANRTKVLEQVLYPNQKKRSNDPSVNIGLQITINK